jgi:HEAT repeat protein
MKVRIHLLVLTTMVLIFITPLTYADVNSVDFKNETTIEMLIENLANQNVSIKSNAVKNLVKIGEPAIDSLIQGLKNNNLEIRENSAFALGKIGDERAIEPLIELLDDENREVNYAAEVALGDIGGESIDILISYAKDQNKSLYSREKVVRALGECGEKAVPHLIQLLSDEDNIILRPVVISALDEIGEPAVEPLIQQLESDDPSVKSHAIKSLGYMGDERAIEPLSKALSDESEQVRNLAKSSIERIENQNKHLTIEIYGKIPDFYIEDERREWLDNLDIIGIASKREMGKYIQPEGPVSLYGYDYEGYITVGFSPDSEVNESQINEIYDIFNQHAQEIGIENVPVLFSYEDIVVDEKTPGFTVYLLITVILVLYRKAHKRETF